MSARILLGGDLPVTRLGYGAMRLVGRGVWGEPSDPLQARAVLRRAVALGVELIDTADSYGPGVSEQQIADALHPYPEGLVIATKGGLLRPGPFRWTSDARPEHLRRACEASLERLRLERLDLYQLHAVDPAVPLEESVGALAELRREGKVRHVGLCNVTVEQIERARAIVPIASVQNRYSLGERASEDVLRHCERLGIPFLCWFPLEKGSLGRRAGRLGAIAAENGATPAQLALAWLLQRSATTVPIPGTGSLAHLEENARSLDLTLAAAELQALERYRLGGRAALLRAARGIVRRFI